MNCAMHPHIEGSSACLLPAGAPIALTLIYYDQRIRLEGYDIERLIEASGMNTPAPAPTLDIVVTATETEETGL